MRRLAPTLFVLFAAYSAGCGHSPMSSEAPPSRPSEVATMRATEWQSLFNGQDLAGWEHLGGGSVRVENGLLILESSGQHRPGYLLARPEVSNFEVRWRCRLTHGDSGLFFLAQRDPHSPAAIRGPQVQLNRSPGRSLGGIYETQGRGWLARTPANVEADLLSHADWLDCLLAVRGPTIRVSINGRETVEIARESLACEVGDFDGKAGRLAFQMHGGAGCQLEVASVELREFIPGLPTTSVARAEPTPPEH
jgi:hypothetical protein